MSEQPPQGPQDDQPTPVDPFGGGQRVEPIDLQLEMQRSYLDYAMSVIVGRALPDVRDGLKPVHRRVLYAMYDGGYRPDRGYSKCSRVVGDVMGQYHPHGDSAIYDTLVRLAQPWSLRYPLVDGQGNFGSPGNDPAAAMRYCVTGDTRVRLADGSSVPIADLAPDAVPNSDTDVELKVLDRDGLPVRATKVFHSGEHPTLRVTTTGGHTLTGTHNHPVLTLRSVAGVPTLLWSLMSELQADDVVVMSRAAADDRPYPLPEDLDAAFLAGAWVSEGWFSPARAGFNNTDREFFERVLEAYDRIVGGPRYVSTRRIASGSQLHEIDVQNVDALRRSCLAPLLGRRSAEKRVPEFVWRSGALVRGEFLKALFTGDGSVSALPRNSVQLSYSTRSRGLADDVQQLLLDLGIVSTLVAYANGEYKVVLTNRREVRLFAERIGFPGAKADRFWAIREALPRRSRSLSGDHVPFLADFLRRHGGRDEASSRWLARHNVDRIERWDVDHELISAHLTTEAQDVAHPLVDGRFHYTRVASVEDAGVQPVWSLRVDTEDHAFITNGFVSHNTECRLASLAMEMVRDIDKDTVDFKPNYDGRTSEPVILPSRFPNLLVNGSTGIAVGMATNIPPHNLREVADGVQWLLANPEADDEALLEALLERVKGPDFPTKGLIVGSSGIEDAYRTGRGTITMRAVVEVEEIQNRTCLVVSELPYMVNPDNLKLKIAELVDHGRITGIADLRDDTSSRTGGLRIVIVLKRDAVAKVVLNNLYKHTQLQETFGANMLALVDDVPRTLSLDKFVRNWVDHQIDVVVRRTRYLLAEAEKQAHIYRGYVKALDALDDVIALIRRSPSADEAKNGLMDLLDIDEDQALAILGLQLRRLAALERQEIINRLAELETQIADYLDILASPVRQRQIVSDELTEIVARHGDERRTRIIPAEGDMMAEDLIPVEEMVVTITRDGYAKRTRSDNYRAQRRGGKGVRGAQLRSDDVVEHFFVTTTHHWLLFFTNLGRVYRAKTYELPEGARDAKGQHVANLMAFQPGENIAQVLDIPHYEEAPFLVLATRGGRVKKTRLTEYDSNRSGGVIAINLLDDDELVSARLVDTDADLLLVSRKGMSVRFTADDGALRPMGRATSGVTGMKFRGDDELLSMDAVRDDDAYVFVVTENGYAKRTPLGDYRVQGRGGLGIKVAKLSDARGDLVGAMIAGSDDEVLVVMEGGKVVRSAVSEVPAKGRDTMGVVFAKPDNGDRIIAVARNSERALAEEIDEAADVAEAADPAGVPDADGVGEVSVVEDAVEADVEDDDDVSEDDADGDATDA